MRKLALLATLIVAGWTSQAAGAGPARALPIHLRMAKQLVQALDPAHNVYGSHPTYIHWPRPAQAPQAANRTVCSSFLTLLLRHSYHLTKGYFRSWLGSASPLAQRYYRAIRDGDRFTRIRSATAVQPGDIIAIKYLDHHGTNSDGTKIPSGHVLLVAGKPGERKASWPRVRGTNQYSVDVIDSALSGHGPHDTRLAPDGTWHTGVGEGIFRLYAAQGGRIVGYTWSALRQSRFYGIDSIRRITVGRLQLAAS